MWGMERRPDTMKKVATVEADNHEEKESSKSDKGEEGTDIEGGKGKEVGCSWDEESDCEGSVE
jgi:hypothetical protein